MTKEQELEARLENTEKALVALVNICRHRIPKEAMIMIEEYFNANRSLGSKIYEHAKDDFINKEM